MNRLSSNPMSPVSGAIETPEKRDVMADEIVETYRQMGILMNDEDEARIRASLDTLNDKIGSGNSILITGDMILTADVEVLT
ncbi:MAG: hypothetical protein JW885_02595 [Deltaproteobacteria bacterium]|nr:hypothetical protein [Candidatus Zymogenaceae bacterium]